VASDPLGRTKETGWGERTKETGWGESRVTYFYNPFGISARVSIVSSVYLPPVGFVQDRADNLFSILTATSQSLLFCSSVARLRQTGGLRSRYRSVPEGEAYVQGSGFYPRYLRWIGPELGFPGVPGVN
jgi:hypothetical protein